MAEDDEDDEEDEEDEEDEDDEDVAAIESDMFELTRTQALLRKCSSVSPCSLLCSHSLPPPTK
jgi:hypothetical protein